MRVRVRLRWAGVLAMAGLVVVAGCGLVVRPARGHGGADMVVQDFCRKFGRQQGLGILSLFADSARFDLEGLGVSFVGREGLARLADYGLAAHSRLVPREVDVRQDTVRCKLGVCRRTGYSGRTTTTS